MREVDGLRALQVRVPRQRPIEVALRDVEQRAGERLDLIGESHRVIADVEREVSRDLVVARSAGVDLAAARASELRDAALDRHVDVDIVGAEREAALGELLLDLVERGVDRGLVGLADDPLLGEHRGVRARLRDVVGPEAAIDVE